MLPCQHYMCTINKFKIVKVLNRMFEFFNVILIQLYSTEGLQVKAILEGEVVH